MKSTESLTEYYSDIQSLGRKLQIDDESICDYFINGLPTDIAKIVATHQTANIRVAFQKACLYMWTEGNGEKSCETDIQTEVVLELLAEMLEAKESISFKILAKLIDILQKVVSNLDDVTSYFEQTKFKAMDVGRILRLVWSPQRSTIPCEQNYIQNFESRNDYRKPKRKHKQAFRCYKCGAFSHIRKFCPKSNSNNT